MRKRIMLALAGATLAISLSACGSVAGSDGAGGHRLYVENVPVNGQDVTCVVYDDRYHAQGGLSCDFGTN